MYLCKEAVSANHLCMWADDNVPWAEGAEGRAMASFLSLQHRGSALHPCKGADTHVVTLCAHLLWCLHLLLCLQSMTGDTRCC